MTKILEIAINPMISSLSILNYVDMDSEEEVLGYGISLILLNLGMYFAAPVVLIIQLKKRSNWFSFHFKLSKFHLGLFFSITNYTRITFLHFSQIPNASPYSLISETSKI
ncbi:MAG: hypothetical protein OER82_06315 [Nitrosopumilus sp.]|nr:hypothetical protein [Nitrosopumilus sp.]MDH3488738.1 hypothetical protein [Nitrosopumilus sp.]MDH3765406.1 hypothetical protein [Nitrosopumilus sp.]MDH3780240.1 hypothetical protein [Nitrosopumilus sp.]